MLNFKNLENIVKNWGKGRKMISKVSFRRIFDLWLVYFRENADWWERLSRSFSFLQLSLCGSYYFLFSYEPSNSETRLRMYPQKPTNFLSMFDYFVGLALKKFRRIKPWHEILSVIYLMYFHFSGWDKNKNLTFKYCSKYCT